MACESSCYSPESSEPVLSDELSLSPEPSELPLSDVPELSDEPDSELPDEEPEEPDEDEPDELDEPDEDEPEELDELLFLEDEELLLFLDEEELLEELLFLDEEELLDELLFFDEDDEDFLLEEELDFLEEELLFLDEELSSSVVVVFFVDDDFFLDDEELLFFFFDLEPKRLERMELLSSSSSSVVVVVFFLLEEDDEEDDDFFLDEEEEDSFPRVTVTSSYFLFTTMLQVWVYDPHVAVTAVLPAFRPVTEPSESIVATVSSLDAKVSSEALASESRKVNSPLNGIVIFVALSAKSWPEDSDVAVVVSVLSDLWDDVVDDVHPESASVMSRKRVTRYFLMMMPPHQCPWSLRRKRTNRHLRRQTSCRYTLMFASF